MPAPYFSARFSVEPKGKERPRFNRKTGRTYTPKATQEYETLLTDLLRDAVGDAEPNTEDDLFVYVRFQLPDGRRKDIDNLLKALFDAANKIVWGDDRQVTRVLAEVQLRCPEPGIDFSVTVEP